MSCPYAHCGATGNAVEKLEASGANHSAPQADLQGDPSSHTPLLEASATWVTSFLAQPGKTLLGNRNSQDGGTHGPAARCPETSGLWLHLPLKQGPKRMKS